MWSARAGPLGCAVVLLAAGCGSSDKAETTSKPAPTHAATSTSAPRSAEVLGVSVTAATAGKPGVVVQFVPAAEKSRLRAGDVIVAYNGDPVKTVEELQKVAETAELGKPFTLTVIRGSNRFPLTEVPSAVTYLGVNVKDSDGEGALVVAPAPGSPAAKAGLERGDVVTAVGGTEVKEVSDLLETVAAHSPGDTVVIGFSRGSHELHTKATLTTRPSG